MQELEALEVTNTDSKGDDESENGEEGLEDGSVEIPLISHVSSADSDALLKFLAGKLDGVAAIVSKASDTEGDLGEADEN